MFVLFDDQHVRPSAQRAEQLVLIWRCTSLSAFMIVLPGSSVLL